MLKITVMLVGNTVTSGVLLFLKQKTLLTQNLNLRFSAKQEVYVKN